MFTLQKQTEDVKAKKVTDNGQTPLLVHFDKKQGAAAGANMQVNLMQRNLDHMRRAEWELFFILDVHGLQKSLFSSAHTW